MKKVTFYLLFISMIFASFPVLGQDETGINFRPFGIGLHLEQFKIDEINYNVAPANKLILIFNSGNTLRIEPEIGFSFGKNKTSDLSYDNISVGIGFLGMKQFNNLNFYGGGRIEYASLNWEELDYYSSNVTTNIMNRFSLGPVIGCEYYFNENFSFGGEMIFKYSMLTSKIKPNPTNSDPNEENYFTTNSGLFVRFFF